MRRRGFLAALAALPGARAGAKPPPVRPITRPPGFHWFGYYDKLQFDPTGRYALGVEGRFEHRLPAGDDTIEIGMVDLADRDRWIELGETAALRRPVGRSLATRAERRGRSPDGEGTGTEEAGT